MTDIATQNDIAYLVYLVRTVPILPGDTHHGTSGRRQYFLDFNSDNWFSHSCYRSPDRNKTAAEISERRKSDLAIVDFKIAGIIMGSPELGKIIEFSKILRDTVRANAKAIQANGPSFGRGYDWDEAEELTARFIRPDARKYIEGLLQQHKLPTRDL